MLLSILCLLPLFLFGKTGTDKSKIEQLSEQLSEAIDARNFRNARVTMTEMIPLMKDILKAEKKELAVLKKAESPEKDPNSFEKNLERKKELYNSFKKLVEVSPAALRGKSQMIKDGVKEFTQLI